MGTNCSIETSKSGLPRTNGNLSGVHYQIKISTPYTFQDLHLQQRNRYTMLLQNGQDNDYLCADERIFLAWEAVNEFS
jgi:hypothetical protein